MLTLSDMKFGRNFTVTYCYWGFKNHEFSFNQLNICRKSVGNDYVEISTIHVPPVHRGTERCQLRNRLIHKHERYRESIGRHVKCLLAHQEPWFALALCVNRD